MGSWWRGLQTRERRLIGLAGAIALVVLVWTLVWEPLIESRRAVAEQVATQRALLDWLDRMAPQIRQWRLDETPQRASDGRSTLSIIDQSARAAGLAGALRRIEPGAGDEIRVDFAGAAFPELMQWLEALVSEHPMAVVRFSADRTGPGRVDSVVVLRRAAGE
jgi:general secretion pathway protein M